MHVACMCCLRIGITILQVYLAKWQETDVAVKVITQMHKLSPLRGIHGQTGMQPCHVRGRHASTQAAGQAEGLGNQHMGIDLQGQCNLVDNNVAACNESKGKTPISTSKLVSLDQQCILVGVVSRLLCLGLLFCSPKAQSGTCFKCT